LDFTYSYFLIYAVFVGFEVFAMVAMLAACILAGFSLGLFFDLEDGGDMFLQTSLFLP
jgi:hypothetical protein